MTLFDVLAAAGACTSSTVVAWFNYRRTVERERTKRLAMLISTARRG
jgi:hypothetical protein